MLNGVDPLLVIFLKKKPPEDIVGPPLPTGFFDDIGFPITIYLGEKLTGIYVDSETRGIDVTTRVEPVRTKNELTLEVDPPIVSQTSADSQLTISLLTTTDCVLVVALIALMEMIVDRLVSREYSITYINGPTVVFGALLHRFSSSVSQNDNLMRLELVLSTAAKESPTPKAAVSTAAKVVGAVPNIGGVPL